MQVEDGSGFNPSSVNPAIMKSGKEALSQERKHLRLPIQIVHALLKCWSVDRKESLFLPNSADREANLTLPPTRYEDTVVAKGDDLRLKSSITPRITC